MAIETKSGDDNKSDMLGRHGDLTAAYKSSYAKHSAAANGDHTGYGVGLGEPDAGLSESAFSTSDSGVGHESTSDEGSDTSGYGKGVGPAIPLVQSSVGDSAEDSNLTAGGKPVG